MSPPFIIAFLIILLVNCARQEDTLSFDGLDRIPASDTLTRQITLAVRQVRKTTAYSLVPPLRPYLEAAETAAQALQARDLAAAPPETVVQALRKVVYREWNIRFDSLAEDIGSILPQTVFDRKKGGCLGVSLLFLVLAEKVRVPVYGVVLPGHFFLRYDNGATRINIEPNREGIAHPDSYYVQRYGTAGSSFYTLGNLNRQKVIAVLNYAAGTWCLPEGKCADAAQFLQQAVSAWPVYAEAYGNLGLAYDCLGMAEQARGALAKVLELRPNDPKARMNLEALRRKYGN